MAAETPTLTVQQWTDRKEEIIRLYVGKGYPLRLVRQKLACKGFERSDSQYRTKFKQWKLRKPRRTLKTTMSNAPTGQRDRGPQIPAAPDVDVSVRQSVEIQHTPTGRDHQSGAAPFNENGRDRNIHVKEFVSSHLGANPWQRLGDNHNIPADMASTQLDLATLNEPSSYLPQHMHIHAGSQPDSGQVDGQVTRQSQSSTGQERQPQQSPQPYEITSPEQLRYLPSMDEISFQSIDPAFFDAGYPWPICN